jgi:hypothetical protein
MLQEEFDRGLECALFACFDPLIGEIPTNCKAMLAALKVLPLVPRCELSPTEDLIGLRLRFKGELFVNSTRVDQKRSFGNRCIFLVGGNKSAI